MNSYNFRVIIEPDEDGFHGFVPLLRGCHTWGKTIEETQKNLREAIECYLQGLLLEGEIIPQEHHSSLEYQEFIPMPRKALQPHAQIATA